jgi:hypothetical protein
MVDNIRQQEQQTEGKTTTTTSTVLGIIDRNLDNEISRDEVFRYVVVL